MTGSFLRTMIVGISIFFYTQFMSRFISQVFVLNFSTSGLNGSIVLVLLYLSGLIIVPLTKSSGSDFIHSSYFIISVFIIGFLTLIPNAIIKIISSGLLLGIISVVLFTNSIDKQEVTKGVIFGLSLTWTIYSLTFGIGLFTTSLGYFWYLVIVILYCFMLYFNPKIDILEENLDANRFYFLLFLLIFSSLFISNPFVITSWNLYGTSLLDIAGFSISNYTTVFSVLMAISGIVGLYAGYELINTGFLKNSLPQLLFILSSIILIYVHIFPLLFFALLSMTIPLIVYQIEGESTNLEYQLIGWQFLLLILVFLQVASGHWYFLPSVLHPILSGMAGFYLVLLSVGATIYGYIYGGNEL